MSAAGTSTASTAGTTTSTASAAGSSTTSAAISTRSPISRTTIRAISSDARMGYHITVEVRLRLVGKITSAFDGQRRCMGRRCRRLAFEFVTRTVCRYAFFHRRSTHLGALLFQNCFAREPDAVAFHRQHLHQHLIAFFEFVAYILDPVLSHFADVQQSVRSR